MTRRARPAPVHGTAGDACPAAAARLATLTDRVRDRPAHASTEAIRFLEPVNWPKLQRLLVRDEAARTVLAGGAPVPRGGEHRLHAQGAGVDDRGRARLHASTASEGRRHHRDYRLSDGHPRPATTSLVDEGSLVVQRARRRPPRLRVTTTKRDQVQPAVHRRGARADHVRARATRASWRTSSSRCATRGRREGAAVPRSRDAASEKAAGARPRAGRSSELVDRGRGRRQGLHRRLRRGRQGVVGEDRRKGSTPPTTLVQDMAEHVGPDAARRRAAPSTSAPAVPDGAAGARAREPADELTMGIRRWPTSSRVQRARDRRCSSDGARTPRRSPRRLDAGSYDADSAAADLATTRVARRRERVPAGLGGARRRRDPRRRPERQPHLVDSRGLPRARCPGRRSRCRPARQQPRRTRCPQRDHVVPAQLGAGDTEFTLRADATGQPAAPTRERCEATAPRDRHGAGARLDHRPMTDRGSPAGRRRAQRSGRRAAPAHDHVLRRRRLHRAVRPPGARGLPRAHAGLPRGLPRRDRGPLRGPHRPAQGRRHAVDLRLPGGARERRRAGGAGRARAGARGARALGRTASTAGESLDVRVGVHHGPVYLDLDEDDIYGLAANVGARLQGARRAGHGRRLRRGPAAGRGPLRDRGRRAPARQGRRRAARSRSGSSGERPCPSSARGRPRWSSARTSSSGCGRPGRGSRPATPTARPGVLIRGDAGVGKSRLVAALADEVRAASAPSSSCTARRSTLDAGFHPVRSLLEAPLRHRRRRRRRPSGSTASPASWRPLGLDARRDRPAAGAGARHRSERRLRPGRDGGPQARGAGRPGRPRLRRRVHRRRGRRSSWPRTCTGSTTRRARCWPTCVRIGPGSVLVVGTSRNRERRPVGDDRAAAADARRPPRAHRRARATA